MYRIVRPLEEYIREHYDDHSTVKIDFHYKSYIKFTINSRSDLLNKMAFTVGWPIDVKGKPLKLGAEFVEEFFIARAISVIDYNVKLKMRQYT